jgi:hypothetical protein
MLVGCTAYGRKGLKDQNFLSPGSAPKLPDLTEIGWFVKDLSPKITKTKGDSSSPGTALRKLILAERPRPSLNKKTSRKLPPPASPRARGASFIARIAAKRTQFEGGPKEREVKPGCEPD